MSAISQILLLASLLAIKLITCFGTHSLTLFIFFSAHTLDIGGCCCSSLVDCRLNRCLLYVDLVSEVAWYLSSRHFFKLPTWTLEAYFSHANQIRIEPRGEKNVQSCKCDRQQKLNVISSGCCWLLSHTTWLTDGILLLFSLNASPASTSNVSLNLFTIDMLFSRCNAQNCTTTLYCSTQKRGRERFQLCFRMTNMK